MVRRSAPRVSESIVDDHLRNYVVHRVLARFTKDLRPAAGIRGRLTCLVEGAGDVVHDRSGAFRVERCSHLNRVGPEPVIEQDP